jgi:hypothetical protein
MATHSVKFHTWNMPTTLYIGTLRMCQQISAGRTLRAYRPIMFKMYGLTRSVATAKANVFKKKMELAWEKDLQKF